MMRSRRAVTIWLVYLDRPLVSSDGQWKPVSSISVDIDDWPVRVCSAEATQQSAPSPAIAGSR